MKKIITVALSLMCILCCVSCNKEGVMSLEGTWVLIEGTEYLISTFNQTYTHSAGDITLTFTKKDHSVKLSGSIVDDELKGTYEVNGTTIEISNLLAKNDKAYIVDDELLLSGKKIGEDFGSANSSGFLVYNYKFKKSK